VRVLQGVPVIDKAMGFALNTALMVTMLVLGVLS
jgi:hypothetical protein